MKIIVKTNLVHLEIEDEPLMDKEGCWTKRAVPEITVSLKSAIDECIRLHTAIINPESSAK